MEGTVPAGPVPPAWAELLALSHDETGERQLMERLLALGRREHGARAAGLYLEHGGTLEREAAAGDGLPQTVEAGATDGLGSLRLSGGRLLFSSPGAPAPIAARAASDPLTLLLASALKTCRLKQELKEQQFQVNYRVVELEALYDV